MIGGLSAVSRSELPTQAVKPSLISRGGYFKSDRDDAVPKNCHWPSENGRSIRWGPLHGALGDQVNAMMAANGYNLRLILETLALWLRIFKGLLAFYIGSSFYIQNETFV